MGQSTPVAGLNVVVPPVDAEPGGWSLAMTLPPQTTQRLEKLVVLSRLSYAFQVCAGTRVAIPPSEAETTSIVQRFRHIHTSTYRNAEQLFFRLGRVFRVWHLHLRLAPAFM